MSVLKKHYESEVKPRLMEKFGYKNPMLVPRPTKVTLHMGVAEATKDKNALQDCENEMTLIAGQKPVRTLAKKSISNFKLRQGQPLGVKVTLRGKRMWDFLYRFYNIVSPRIKDFRGFNRKCDGQGNYSLGIDDHQIFPELNLDEVKRQQGMHITVTTTASKDEECVSLLEDLGCPFTKNVAAKQ